MEESNQQKWERYIQNLRRVRTLSHPKFPPETAPEFLLEAIQGNAVRCFDLMKENNALLGELVYTRDAKTLSDSDIAELEEAAGRLFNYANSEDCGVAYKIHELLLKAARFRDDVPMIVRELYYNGITLHYINVRDEDHDVNLLWPRIHAFFLEGADYIARYEELDRETRQYIIRCVGNIRLAVSRQTKEDCHRYMELFDLAMSIITSPYYQELDPDIPWARFTYSMHMDQMTLMAYLVSDEEFDRQLDELGWSPGDAATRLGMYMEVGMYNLEKSIRDAFRSLLELLFAAASLLIDTVRTFFLVVLSVLGPIAFSISVWDGLQSTLGQWFTRYISVYLWLPVSDLFSCMLAKIQVLMLQNDIAELQGNPDYSLDDSNCVYIIFMLIGIVGYFTVPTVSGWIVQAGGGGNYSRNLNRTATKAGGFTAGAGGAALGNIGGRIRGK